ncbi:hypothetical protein Tco_1414102, partial [Tanacetum coccineum]
PAGSVVPTGKDNSIVSTGSTKVIPAGRTILFLCELRASIEVEFIFKAGQLAFTGGCPINGANIDEGLLRSSREGLGLLLVGRGNGVLQRVSGVSEKERERERCEKKGSKD